MTLTVYPRIVASWKLLVVDDDPDIRRVAALALGRLGGFQVTVASCAQEALDEVSRQTPDLVLLDVAMPGMDGPQTLAALRALPGMSGLRVVFFTAASSEAEARRLSALGAIGVLAKPFDIADLPRRIRTLGQAAGLE